MELPPRAVPRSRSSSRLREPTEIYVDCDACPVRVVGGFPNDGSETEGAGKDRPLHMDVEAKPAFASRNIEIEAAVAEVEVPRWLRV
jgi:hypothetical protein